MQALNKVRDWTGNGLHAPQQVGAKTTANCEKILQLNDGTLVARSRPVTSSADRSSNRSRRLT